MNDGEHLYMDAGFGPIANAQQRRVKTFFCKKCINLIKREIFGLVWSI